MVDDRRAELEDDHTLEAISSRIDAASESSHLGDFVLGGVDGAVTTFAIVAGSAGAGVSSGVALVLGIANVLADGLSMAAGNYLARRTETQRIEQIRQVEEMHIDEIPEGEREEIRQIFIRKGFEDALLDQIVEIITRDRNRWIDTMLTEEWGLAIETISPIKSGVATFVAFLLAGLVPLLPLFVLSAENTKSIFPICATMTATTFFLIGWFRGKVTAQKPIVAAVETLLLGGIAAGVAYAVGAVLHSWVA